MRKYTYELYQFLLIISLLVILLIKPKNFLPDGFLFTIFGSLLILIAVIMDIYWEIFWYKNVVRPGSKRIITKGIYAYVRHPFLLAIISASFGLAIVFNSLQCLVVSIISFIVIFIGSKKEEEELIERYGSEYREYMNKVKYRFIPKLI